VLILKYAPLSIVALAMGELNSTCYSPLVGLSAICTNRLLYVAGANTMYALSSADVLVMPCSEDTASAGDKHLLTSPLVHDNPTAPAK
jgi:hypothetical protein